MPTQDNSSDNASTFFGIVDAVRQSLMTTTRKDLAALLGPTLVISAIPYFSSEGENSAAAQTAVKSLAEGLLALTLTKLLGACELESYLAIMKTSGAVLATIGAAMHATQSILTESSPAPSDVDQTAIIAAFGTQVYWLAMLEAARLRAIAKTEKTMELAVGTTGKEVLLSLLE